MNCGSCLFFVDANDFWSGEEDEKSLSDDREMFGFCRRHAPKPNRGLVVKEIQWPLVHSGSDWCGEYANKHQETEATDGTANG
jgi:hypothetical protein